jgi:hypothetical protein
VTFESWLTFEPWVTFESWVTLESCVGGTSTQTDRQTHTQTHQYHDSALPRDRAESKVQCIQKVHKGPRYPKGI